MKAEEIIEELKKEYPLSKKYKYRAGTDDGGRTLEIYNVPKRYAHRVRKKIPMKYKGMRTIVFYQEERGDDNE